MNTETTDNTGCCPDSSCGCRIDVYPTAQECPDCGKRLRMTGRAQSLELRLSCHNCGYASPMLSREEIGELL